MSKTFPQSTVQGVDNEDEAFCWVGHLSELDKGRCSFFDGCLSTDKDDEKGELSLLPLLPLCTLRHVSCIGHECLEGCKKCLKRRKVCGRLH